MSVKTAGVGHFQIPTAPAAGVSVVSGAANTLTATAIVLSASTSAIYITGVHVEAAAASAATYKLVQLCIGGAGSETSIGQYLVPLSTGSTVALGFHNIFPPIPVANASRLTVKTADSVGTQTTLVTVECILQSNVVDDGITVGTVNLVNTTTTVTNQLTAATIATGVWQDATAGDFSTASSIGKALYIANVAPGAAGGHFIAGTNAATTITTGLTTTFTGNLSGNVTGSVASVTGAVGSVTAGVTLAATAVQAIWDALTSALTTVGSIGKLLVDNVNATISSRMATYTQPTGFLAATFPTGTVANTTNITAGTVTTTTNLTNAATAGDFTAAMKTSLNAATPASVTGAVGSVTGNVGGNVAGSVGSVTAGVTVTTNNDKTGYSLTQTFPSNFSALAITAGGAVTSGTVSDKTGYSLVAGYDQAKTAAQAGDAMTLTAAYNAAKTASQAGDAMALTGGERTTLAGVINTTAILESYRANGAAPTPAQFMSEVLAHLGEAAIVGTTKTINQLDHATPAETFTLDSATAPSRITRAT